MKDMALSHMLHVFACYLLSWDMALSNQHLLSWFDAQDICRLNNATLLASVPKDVNLKGKVWIGKYRRLSSWIKIVGCFTEESVKTAPTTVYEMQIGSAGFCQEICMSSNMTMFAIKLKECRCVKRIPLKEKVLPSECDAVCYAKGARIEKPYFEECGGNGTFTVFQSGTEDENAMGSDIVGSSCVAIKCSKGSTSRFYYEGNCSLPHQPQCSKNATVLGSWMESMQFCKLNISSTYVFEDIYLKDINKTCDTVELEMADIHWLGVIKEVYNGNDRGLNIEDKEKHIFNGCQLCTYNNGGFRGCDSEICKDEQNIDFVLCEKMREDSLSQISSILHISNVSSLLKLKPSKKDPISTTTKSTVATTMLTISTIRNATLENLDTRESTLFSTTKTTIMQSPPTLEISPLEEPNAQNVTTLSFSATITTSTPTNGEKLEEKLSNEKDDIIYPIVIAFGIGGGIFIAFIFTYFCYCKKKDKTKTQNHLEGKERSEGTRASGLINCAYFTIELQDQAIKSSSLDNRIETLYTDTLAKEEIYDHLRDKQSIKDTNDDGNKYDTTKNAIAMKEQYSQSTEGTYDRLGDKKYSKNTDETYYHAFSVIKKRSDYDVTEVRKQYILDSPYNHVEIVSNENDTEQDTISNHSENQNEDHTYFILEQG